MIVNGITATGDYTDEAEVIDLINPSNKCVQAPRYPYLTMGTHGGFINENTPMVCGGKDISGSVCCTLTSEWNKGK